MLADDPLFDKVDAIAEAAGRALIATRQDDKSTEPGDGEADGVSPPAAALRLLAIPRKGAPDCHPGMSIAPPPLPHDAAVSA